MQLTDQTKKQQGEAYNKALEEVKSENNTISVTENEFIITAVFSKPEGYYWLETNNGLVWNNPSPSENLHLGIFVQDVTDYRFIPYLEIFCQLYDSENNLIGEKIIPFNWDPYLFHYGTNWIIPNDGEYLLKIIIKAPNFIRHHETLGNKFPNDVSVSLNPIEIKIS